jgi:hypothetical protein
MNAAYLDNLCHFLWVPLTIDRTLMRESVIPFVYGAGYAPVLAQYNAIPDDARMNIFHTVMFLGLPLRLHPSDDVRFKLEQAFAAKGISVPTLRAALVHFVKRCLDDTGIENPIENRIQLGKRLDELFRAGRSFPRAEESKALFNRWPTPEPGFPSIAQAARISETHGLLEDYAIEDRFTKDSNTYPWNNLPQITTGGEAAIHEPTVLDAFFYAAYQRMLKSPEDPQDFYPEFWPLLKPKGASEQVEYVVIRPW